MTNLTHFKSDLEELEDDLTEARDQIYKDLGVKITQLELDPEHGGRVWAFGSKHGVAVSSISVDEETGRVRIACDMNPGERSASS